MAESVKENNKDFKEGLKTTGLFGGVQIFKILISIISTKFVAVLLGPAGYGISSLLSSTTGLIGTVSGLGLRTSAVRDVSEAYASHDNNRFNKTVHVFRRLVWITGLLGLLACALLSPLWSHLNFGNYNYTWAFIALSITLLLGQISSGQGVVLQGTRSFKNMAKSGMIGSVLGLITTVPIYYILGIDGIVPVMIITSVISICLTFYYSRKIKVENVYLTWKETFTNGNIMLKMGFFIMLQSFFSTFCAYIIRIYISRTGSVEDVGLYNSGFNIINTYVGLVFTAMATDYYPRLSSYANDEKHFLNAVNQEMELSLILLAPMIALFLVFGELGVQILYSSKFLGATIMILCGILGIFLKAPGWCLGFTFLAKGDSKAFFWNELAAETINLVLCLISYNVMGLNGLGVAFILEYLIYDVQCIIVCKIRYNYKLNYETLRIFIPQFVISLIIFLMAIYLSSLYKYTFGIVLFSISLFLAYKELSKKADVKAIIANKLFVKRHKNRNNE